MTRKNILVIKLGALGDFIYALGPMAAIRKHHPADNVTLLTTSPFEKMAKQCGYFNDVLVDKKPRTFDISGWLRLRHTLNQRKFDRVYDLQNNDRTSFYLRLFSLRPEWVGAAKGASHRNTSPERSSGHAFTGHCQTLALAGIKGICLDPLNWMTGENLPEYRLQKPYVLVVSGCSPEHPEKRWPVEYYRTIISRLISQNVQPVLLGTKDDRLATERIAHGIEGVLDLTGKTSLSDIPDLARDAVCAVGNDTGPMHICAVAGCPVVMMFCNRTSSIKMHAPPKSSDVFAFEAHNLEDIFPQMVWDKIQNLLNV